MRERRLAQLGELNVKFILVLLRGRDRDVQNAQFNHFGQ
ncbi:hypothetical protein SODG_000298 [Sodalis praecaptivus]